MNLALQLLLKRGAVVDVRSNHGVTPLFAAAAHGHLTLLKLLAEAGGDTECTLRNKMPDGSVGTMRPIDVAAQKGHDEVVEYLQVRVLRGRLIRFVWAAFLIAICLLQSRGSALTLPGVVGDVTPCGITIAEAQKQAAAATAALQKPEPSLEPGAHSRLASQPSSDICCIC